jgi:cytidyltransferase-like protein
LNEKLLLGEVFSAGLTKHNDLDGIARRLGESKAAVEGQLSALRKKGLIWGSASRPQLTEKGRRRIRVVFNGGGFEIIHPGHLYTIEQAKKLGDVLVVVLARSSTIRKRKGREPVAREPDRLALMSSLRQVDAAILGVEGSIYETLERVKPDVVALGYDQHHAEKDIRREARRRGIRLKVVRLKARDMDIKTSKILAEFF